MLTHQGLKGHRNKEDINQKHFNSTLPIIQIRHREVVGTYRACMIGYSTMVLEIQVHIHSQLTYSTQG